MSMSFAALCVHRYLLLIIFRRCRPKCVHVVRGYLAINAPVCFDVEYFLDVSQSFLSRLIIVVSRRHRLWDVVSFSVPKYLLLLNQSWCATSAEFKKRNVVRRMSN